MMMASPRPSSSSSSLRGRSCRLFSSVSTAVCISYRLPLLFLLGPLLCLIASVANVYPEDPRAGRMLGIGNVLSSPSTRTSLHDTHTHTVFLCYT